MNPIDVVDDTLNGFLFNGCFLPTEVIFHLLSFVDYETLCEGRRVCRQWKIIIEDGYFWKYKARVDGHSWPGNFFDCSLHWYSYACIYRHQPFGRNLISNPCGLAKLNSWKVLSDGGAKFAFEQPPLGCEKVPEEAVGGAANSCFATSYHPCFKEQEVNLKRCGLTREVLDGCHRPVITCSDWFAGRLDCGADYECIFRLLDKRKHNLAEHKFRKIMAPGEGCSWSKVEHTFSNYPKGVVIVNFNHGGKDTQYWAGHYGPKMTGASVTISLPPPTM